MFKKLSQNFVKSPLVFCHLTDFSLQLMPSYGMNTLNLSNLKPSKTTETDCIRPLVLKQLKTEMVPFICLLFEKSLQTGQLQYKFRDGYIVRAPR